MKIICKYCRQEIYSENGHYYCPYCGASYEESKDLWTFPNIKTTCDICKKDVDIKDTNLIFINKDLHNIFTVDNIVCNKCKK